MADSSFFFANPEDAQATTLHWAVLRGHSGEVQALLAAKPGTANAADSRWWSPLHWAAGAGQTECAALLVKAGASLTARADESFTPWVEKLTKDKPKDTPEQQAEIAVLEASGQVELAQAMRRAMGKDAKATFGATPLHVAAGMGHADCIRKLLQLGAQPEAANSLGVTAAHISAACGHLAALQALLEGGAEIEAVDGDGNTVLHAAAAFGSLECLQVLVAAGAKVSACGILGCTPLHCAAGEGFAACLRALLAAGADKEAVAASGVRPLHMAASTGGVEVVKVLLEAGANIEAPALFGTTPLHHAAAAGQLDTVLVLVAAGAKLEATTNNAPEARTPIQAAAAAGHMHVVAALAATVADVDYQDPLGISCLHLFLLRASKASLPDAPQKLQQLLETGASVQRACATWPTPLDLMLHCIQDPAECILPAYVPELVRMMTSAGCLVTANRSSPLGDVMMHTLLLWLTRLAPPGFDMAQWPRSLSSSALEVAGVLLQCAAAEGNLEERDDERVFRLILKSGSIPLVTTAAKLFPEQLREGNLVHQAGDIFAQALKALPSPGRGAWSERHRHVVQHFCDLVEALLALGCTPARARIPTREEEAAELTTIPGESFRMELPLWAYPHLREVITIAASGLCWSPAAHPAFPPSFRAAARAMLLANHRGVAVPGAAAASRVQLPLDVIRLILEKAAHPPAAWVAQLQPGHREPARVGTRLLGAAEWASLKMQQHSSAVGVGLVVMAVAAAGTALMLGRGR